MKRLIKNLLFGSEPGPRTIRRGLLKGLQFQIDPANASLRLLGFSERELCEVVRQWSQTAKTAIDIGANEGWYTVYFATRPGMESVIACEPDPSCLSALQANLNLNQRSIKAKLSIIPSFIGSPSPHTRWGDAPAKPAPAAQSAPRSPLFSLEPSAFNLCFALDSLLPGTTGPYLIKIDVEGAELDVLRSGTETLRKLECRLIVETHSEQLEHDCIEFLQQLGYECQLIPNGWYRRLIPEHRSLPHNRWFSAAR